MLKKIILLFLGLTLFIACGKEEKTVVVASKPFAEQYILAELISQVIENKTDIKVIKKMGIGGGTSNIHPAMIKGEIDIYPEYTGTSWLFVLKEKEILEPSVMFEEVKKEYKEKYAIEWLGIYGFNNTFTLAMSKELSESMNIKSYTDLAKKGKKLILGAEYDFFEREDGYKGLQKVYGIDFKKKKELDIGLKYEAISSEKVDIINAFSTDGLLKKYNLEILEDNKNFFPAYQAATLIREETLKKYPELKKVLKSLEGNISNKEMIDLNYKVESEKKDPTKVAKEFLMKKGII